MKVQIPKIIAKDGPVVLICEDDGGLSPEAVEKIHVALYFENYEKAELYAKRLVLGKNPRIDIFSLRMP
jgi:hypothetical protein